VELIYPYSGRRPVIVAAIENVLTGNRYFFQTEWSSETFAGKSSGGQIKIVL
jgi:hypothetical protein